MSSRKPAAVGRAVLQALVGLAVCACGTQPAHTAGCRDRTPTSASIRLAPKNEAGEPLIIEGRVVGADGKPAAGVNVYAYHADAHGYYARPDASARGDNEPRLCGVLRTDANGLYRIATVRPSTLGNMEGGEPHVHFELWGAGHSRTGGILTLRVQGRKRAGDAAAKAFAGVRTASERPIFLDAAGTWRCVRDFRVR